MRDEPEEDQDQDVPVDEVEIVIYPGGQVRIPRIPELARIATALGDEKAAESCLAAADAKVIIGSKKCG